MKESRSDIAKGYLDGAKKKLARAKSLVIDGYFDDAARNAYYSMFHAGKALLSLKDSEPKTHSGTINELQRLYVQEGELPQELISSMTRDLQVRIRSDYEVGIDTTKDISEEIIADAEGLIRAAMEKLQ
jgi:hypothetical protein